MRSTFILSSIAFFCFTFNASAQPEVVDKIAAQVGDNIILLSDLQSQKIQMLQGGVEITKETDCQILEELMYQELLINQAKLDSIEISDQQVDAEMENRLRIIEEKFGSREKMEEFYGKTASQIKEEFRDIIKDRLLADEMERQITSAISVTPKEVQDFYATIPADSIPLINSQLSFQPVSYTHLTLPTNVP
jgi:peptidyl-prolyl cis-trans isomerase SurA